jgi:long-chain acyl-CoA synthetase
MIIQIAYLCEGIMIGYSSPQTITDTSTSIKKGHKGDLAILNPTIMHAVPAVLERFLKAVNQKISASSWLTQTLFNLASKQKLESIRSGSKTVLLDRILFRKISRAVVGKNLRSIISAGALLNQDVHEFVQVCIAPVAQAYGSTETCAGCTIQLPHETATNLAGSVISCCEIRLVNWEEGEYRNTDTPNPRGEVKFDKRFIINCIINYIVVYFNYRFI